MIFFWICCYFFEPVGIEKIEISFQSGLSIVYFEFSFTLVVVTVNKVRGGAKGPQRAQGAGAPGQANSGEIR